MPKSDDRYLTEHEREGGTLRVEEDDHDLDSWEQDVANWHTLYTGTWESTKVIPTSWASFVLECFRACRAKLHRATAEVERLRAENARLRDELDRTRTLWDNGL